METEFLLQLGWPERTVVTLHIHMMVIYGHFPAHWLPMDFQAIVFVMEMDISLRVIRMEIYTSRTVVV
jgi:hypothetical protein